jgi:hypothetical protein
LPRGSEALEDSLCAGDPEIVKLAGEIEVDLR